MTDRRRQRGVPSRHASYRAWEFARWASLTLPNNSPGRARVDLLGSTAALPSACAPPNTLTVGLLALRAQPRLQASLAEPLTLRVR